MRRPDRHHIFHARAWYVTEADRALRQQHLFIPRMDWELHHNGLHKNVLAPPKPTHNMTLGAIAVAQSFSPHMEHPEAIERIAAYFDGFHDAEGRGERIAQNLLQQLVYIEEGYVRRQAA